MTKDANGRAADSGQGLPSAPEVLKRVTTFSALGVALAATAYACGLIVVSAHSSISGYGDIGFARARYVSVGFCFLAFVAMSVLPAYLAGRWGTHLVRGHRRYGAAAILILSLLSLSVLLPGAIVVVQVPGGPAREAAAWAVSGLLIFQCSLSFVSGLVIEIANLGEARSRRKNEEKVLWATCRLGVRVSLPLFFACSILYYAQNLYRIIDVSIGGGNSPVGVLVPCDGDKGPAALARYMDRQSCPGFRGEARVIDRSETHVLVEAQGCGDGGPAGSGTAAVSIPTNVVCGFRVPVRSAAGR